MPSRYAGILATAGACAGMLAAQTKPSDADISNPGRINAADSRFMEKAAQGGMAEVKLGQLAQEKAGNQSVKDFGKRMADDHGKAGEQLKEIASKKGVTLPPSITAKDQAAYDKLSKLSGSDFDRAYMQDMVKDHQMDVAEFRRETQEGKDAETKAFAKQTMPTLEGHLNMAMKINSEVGTSSRK